MHTNCPVLCMQIMPAKSSILTLTGIRNLIGQTKVTIKTQMIIYRTRLIAEVALWLVCLFCKDVYTYIGVN